MDYPMKPDENKDIYLKYTEKARECIESKKKEYVAQIEKIIKAKKLIPGENVIEVTPADINEALNYITPFQSAKQPYKPSIANTLFYGISSTVVLALLCGLFYNYMRFDVTELGIALIVLGIFLIFTAYNGIAATYLSNKEKLQNKQIEKKNILATLENINLSDEYKFKLLNKMIEDKLSGK